MITTKVLRNPYNPITSELVADIKKNLNLREFLDSRFESLLENDIDEYKLVDFLIQLENDVITLIDKNCKKVIKPYIFTSSEKYKLYNAFIKGIRSVIYDYYETEIKIQLLYFIEYLKTVDVFLSVDEVSEYGYVNKAIDILKIIL